jgi:hypothetical protein
MTNLTGAVGGQFSDSSDRIFDLYQSVDFQRLVHINQHPLYQTGLSVGPYVFNFKKQEPPQARAPYSNDGAPDDWSPCDQGLGLHGKLGLREALATSAIAARMQDVAVLLTSATASSATVYGQTPQLSGFNGYAFGEMDTTLNFTINLDVNAGPNWTLATFKGPNVSSEGGTNGTGLVNFSRWAKHSLTMTVIPVCIRPKYFPKKWLNLNVSQLQPAPSNSSSPFIGRLLGEVKDGAIGAEFEIKQPQTKSQLPSITYPADYVPEMGVGTPVWANYLPPCLSPEGQMALAAAPATAKTNLQLQGLDNLIRSQRRF